MVLRALYMDNLVLNNLVNNQTATPEPSTLLMLGTALLVFGGTLRKRRSGA